VSLVLIWVIGMHTLFWSFDVMGYDSRYFVRCLWVIGMQTWFWSFDVMGYDGRAVVRCLRELLMMVRVLICESVSPARAG